MYTFYGYRDGRLWNIHHIDENKLNNSLSNLVYLTREDHSKLHHKGKPSPNKGKHWKLDDETIEKRRATKKDFKWFNNGIKNIMCNPNEVPDGFVTGRIKKEHKWFNNGIKNIICNPKECPDGFVPGICKK